MPYMYVTDRVFVTAVSPREFLILATPCSTVQCGAVRRDAAEDSFGVTKVGM